MRQQIFTITSLTIGALSCLTTTSNAFMTTTRTNQFNRRDSYDHKIISDNYKGSRGSTFRSNNKKMNENLIKLLSSSSSSSSKSTSLPDVSNMKASELRQELQSYGISTKSFFEKSELVEAVEKARSEGKSPIGDSSSGGGAKSASESETKASSSSSSRSEKLAQEMEKCKTMKVGELKKELESYGVSTKSFFEKSEFVRAVAEARIDGVKKSGRGARTSSNNSNRASREEEYDPSYRDVQMQKMDPRSLGMAGMSSVIDVRLG